MYDNSSIMAQVDVNRSIQFVSLDTHPANNALVVSYEILVSVLEGSSGRELARRNKRHQFQVQLSALDKLTREDLEAEQLALDLGELGAEIINKCPLLASGRHNNNLEEEIRLHLLYLIGRRRAQLLAPRIGSSNMTRDRPPSAALARLCSANSAGQQQAAATLTGGRLLGSARRGSAGRETAATMDTANCDVYAGLLAQEMETRNRNDSLLNSYMDQLDEHLSFIEISMTTQPHQTATKTSPAIDLDSQLEGLYGDREEKLASMAGIRRISKRDESLASMASNRLLVCALIRTLRDSEARDQQLSESILYCLLRLTSYQDVYVSAFATDRDPIELERIVADLLVDHVKTLGSLDADNTKHRLLEDGYYYTNSLLMILVNLLRLDNGCSERRLTLATQQQQQQQPNHQTQRANLVSSIVDLFQLLAKHLARCIRLMSKIDRSLGQLNNLIYILRHLSVFKEFVCQLRGQAPFVDSLIGLLNTLQLSRPGSGRPSPPDGSNTKSNQQQLVTDKQTLQRLYQLEMDLLRLVNNLVFDQRLKLKLIRKNLLKCVLRNVVVLLASNSARQQASNTLSPFQRSSILMVPFKCLYELSCHKSVRGELYKSKIIIKCLLEFLLSATMDLKQALGSVESGAIRAQQVVRQQPDQIILEPDCAAHYILSLWANLSSRPEATIYGNDPELLALVGEYVQLTLDNLGAYLSSGPEELARSSANQLMMIYLHSKVLRNVSQHLNPEMGSARGREWTQQMGETMSELLRDGQESLRPILVECLACLSNLIAKNPDPKADSMGTLIERLFHLDCVVDFNGENDDLMLVSIILLANVAKNREICANNQTQTTTIGLRIIEASNFILESRAPTDHEMIISSLYALGQLMAHSSFLRQLSNHLDTMDGPVRRLVELLTGLVLDVNLKASKLSILLLSHLRQLEQQLSMESLVYECRFSTYHNKWLAAIKASGEDLTTDGDFSPNRMPGSQVAGDYESDDDCMVDDPGQLRALDNDSETRSLRGGAPVNEDGDGEEDDDEEEDYDDAEDDDSLSAPDLNVIDPNSMIKHLTSKREFRSKWLDH